MKKIFVSLMVVLMVVFAMVPSFAENIPEGSEPVVSNDAVVEDENTVDNSKADTQDDSSVEAEPQKEPEAKVTTKSVKKAPKEAGTTVEIDSPTADKINDAITASTGATTIVLNDDVTLDKQIVVPSGKVITIKGKSGQNATVKGNRDMLYASRYLMNVAEGGTLTLGESLTLDAANKDVQNEKNFVICNGKLIINGANLINATTYNEKGAIHVTGAKAAFEMNSGTISNVAKYYNLGGVVAISNGATGTMNGGTLKNNKVTSLAGTIFIYNATFTMTDGLITDNTNESDGGAGVCVYGLGTTGESHFTMQGGTISNNAGGCGAGVDVKGGYYVTPQYSSKGKAYFTMNGGTITGNKVSQYKQTACGGGGVFVEYGGEFTMNNGKITNNTVSNGCGGGVATYDYFVTMYGKIPYGDSKWPEDYPAKFVMNGGTISGNSATSSIWDGTDGGCGGGIYIASAKNEIKGGTIENNTATRQGGGVYVGSVPYGVSIYDAIISENDADYIGGGIWICPTGEMKSYINNGIGAYDNTAKGAGADVAIVKNEHKHNLYIADRILGGGPANWYQDGAIDNSVLGAPITSVPRYDPNSDSNIKVTVPEGSEESYALITKPSDASKQLAESKARVYIQNNTATRGGGVGSNGDVYLGESEEEPVEATVIKKWNTEATKDKTTPDKVKVWLTIDGTKVESVELSKTNNWTHTFTGLPNDVKVTFTEEKVEGFTTTYSEMKQDAQTGYWEGTITNTKKPDTPTTPNDKPQKPEDKGVKTGDDSNIALFALLAVLGLAGAAGAFALKRKEEKS